MTKIATYDYLNTLGGSYTINLTKCPPYSSISSTYKIDGSYTSTQLVKESDILGKKLNNIITVSGYRVSGGIAALNALQITVSSLYPVTSDLTLEFGVRNSSGDTILNSDNLFNRIGLLSGSSESKGSLQGAGANSGYDSWYSSRLIPRAPTVTPSSDDNYIYSIQYGDLITATIPSVSFVISSHNSYWSDYDTSADGKTAGCSWEIIVRDSTPSTGISYTQTLLDTTYWTPYDEDDWKIEKRSDGTTLIQGQATHHKGTDGITAPKHNQIRITGSASGYTNYSIVVGITDRDI